MAATVLIPIDSVFETCRPMEKKGLPVGRVDIGEKGRGCTLQTDETIGPDQWQAVAQH